MDFEFYCPSCGQKLSVPSEATGRTVACPRCSKQTLVPDTGEHVATAPPQGNDAAYLVADRRLLPSWENRRSLGMVRAFFQTVSETMTRPSDTFSHMKREGGLWDPLLFAFIVGMFVLLMSIVYQLLGNAMGNSMGNMLQAVSSRMAEAGGEPTVSPPDMPHLNTIFLLALIPLSPFLVVAMLFLHAQVYHACLMLVGGAQREFEVTFRTYCYSTSAALCMLIPCCGGTMAAIWQIVILTIGLARTHDTTTGKALAAVLLPTVFCCVTCMGIFLLFGATMFAAMRTGIPVGP